MNYIAARDFNSFGIEVEKLNLKDYS